MTIHTTKIDHCYCLQVDQQEIMAEIFDINGLQSQGLVRETKKAGRGQVVFFKYQGKSLVLRLYRRGGFIAKLSQSAYLWRGLKQSRAYKELALLDQLQALNLPISRPFAAQVCRHKATYQAALITYQIDGARSFSELLQDAEQEMALWAEVGRVIRQFHEHDVYHSDLNANNILLDANQRVHLIDFDKCEMKSSKHSPWKAQNLQRLQRSLLKLQAKHTSFAYTQEGWDALLDGYKSLDNRS